MRLIKNPWLSMPDYNCFGCCPTNPIGTRMRFYEDGDDIVCLWRPTQNHQSWINTLHGGIQAVLLDEVCGWVVFHKLQTAGVTAKMEMRYHKPVSTLLPYIELRARLQDMRRNVAYVHGEIRTPGAKNADGLFTPGEVLCECVCTYFTFPQDKAKEEMMYIPSTTDDENLSVEQILSKSAE